jgi:hypothetical protein
MDDGLIIIIKEKEYLVLAGFTCLDVRSCGKARSPS